MLLDIYNYQHKYYKEFHSFCLKNCARQVLESQGIIDAIYYINCSLELFIESDSESPFNYTVYHGNDYTFLPRFENKIKIHREQGDQKVIWEKTLSKIEEGLPLIILGDVYYLSYQQHYKKNHGSHSFLLCGYTEDYKSVYVVDWYEPHYFKGTLNVDEFNMARGSLNHWDHNPFSGMEIMYGWAQVETDGFVEKPEKLLMDTVNLTIGQYFEGGYKTCNGYCGIEGLEKVRDQLIYMDDIKWNNLRQLHTQLYIGVKSKKLFQLYLKCFNEKNKGAYIDVLVDLLDEIVLAWDILLLSILKGRVIKTTEQQNKIINNFNIVIDKEKGMFDVLNKIKV